MTSFVKEFEGKVKMLLARMPKVTGDELRSQIRQFHDFYARSAPPGLTDEQIEGIAKDIEHSQGIRAGFGSVVDGKDFEPWLDDAKSEIDDYYWRRYREHLAGEGGGVTSCM